MSIVCDVYHLCGDLTPTIQWFIQKVLQAYVSLPNRRTTNMNTENVKNVWKRSTQKKRKQTAAFRVLNAKCEMHLKPFTFRRYFWRALIRIGIYVCFCFCVYVCTMYVRTYVGLTHNWVDTDNAIKKSWQFMLQPEGMDINSNIQWSFLHIDKQLNRFALPFSLAHASTHSLIRSKRVHNYTAAVAAATILLSPSSTDRSRTNSIEHHMFACVTAFSNLCQHPHNPLRSNKYTNLYTFFARSLRKHSMLFFFSSFFLFNSVCALFRDFFFNFFPCFIQWKIQLTFFFALLQHTVVNGNVI